MIQATGTLGFFGWPPLNVTARAYLRFRLPVILSIHPFLASTGLLDSLKHMEGGREGRKGGRKEGRKQGSVRVSWPPYLQPCTVRSPKPYTLKQF